MKKERMGPIWHDFGALAMGTMPKRSILFLVLVWGCASPSSADRSRVRAELSSLNLAGSPRKECRVPEKDGRVSVYEGVPLSEALRRMGTSVGIHPKGRPPLEYVLVEGVDGYRALFSKAELDPAFVESAVLLADRHDGQALPAGDGPWRLIVPNDQIRSRWVKQVKSIEVSSPD
jgi:hypothetical protein